MNLENLLIALSQNYKLESHTVVMAKILIEESCITDFTKLLKNIIASKKFDFLSKLEDAITRTSTPTELENNIVESYCKELVRKCANISMTAYDNKPKGYNFAKFTELAKYEYFINANTGHCAFNPKEIKLLDSVGGCYRWLNHYDDYDFLADLINRVNDFKKENQHKQLKNNENILKIK